MAVVQEFYILYSEFVKVTNKRYEQSTTHLLADSLQLRCCADRQKQNKDYGVDNDNRFFQYNTNARSNNMTEFDRVRRSEMMFIGIRSESDGV